MSDGVGSEALYGLDDLVNRAIDLGWRVVDACLQPPEGGEPGAIVILVAEGMSDYVRAREPLPELPKVDPLQLDVVTYYTSSWAEQVQECDGDEDWAKQNLILNAVADFGITEDQAEEWWA
jgi:hypothetical protein